MKYEEFKDKLETEVVLTTFEGDVIKGTLFLGDTLSVRLRLDERGWPYSYGIQ